MTQTAAAERAGVSQPFWSRAEAGVATMASLETLTACAAAVDAQLAAFLQAVPGASLPRDIEHVRRQELLIRTARQGGWLARPERAIDREARWSRSIDVYLERSVDHEIAVVEIVDLLADIGATLRGLEDKVAAVRRELATAASGNAWSISGLLVLRATSRNRRLVGELGSLFAARFPAKPTAWLRALTESAATLPPTDGLLWTSVDGARLFAARRGSPEAPQR